MTDQEARAAVYDAIHKVAPDVDTDDLDEGARLRQDLELDSLDFRRLIETISKSTGVNTPDRDYSVIKTVRDLITYVAENG